MACVSSCAAGRAAAPAPAPAAARLAQIEAQLGGRIGVCAIDTGEGREIGYRVQESFALASTYKWLLAAAVLRRCEDGLSLADTMYFTSSDLLPNSPVTEASIDPLTGMGALSLGELCEAAVTVSDNCAANLLLTPMFGPEGLTGFLRATGDVHTRLDRRETELNANRPGDPRDTTVPHAMARSLRRMLTTNEVLSAASRERLIGWMEASRTGLNRLRAGLPEGWRAGDKTGTGANGAYNDVAIAMPAGRAPIVMACYMSGSPAPDADKAAAHAAIARIIVEAMA